jgi:hypothetical protein
VKYDAKHFKLPFPVLIGTKSKIVLDYRLTRLPMLIIVDPNGKILFYDRFASDEEMKEVIDPVLEGMEKEE